jgi:phosphate starvation-inducible PhoH-like protein
MPETMISLDSQDEELAVFGSRDQHLRQVRDALGVKVLARHGEVRVEGEPDRVAQARQVFEELRGLYRRQRSISAGDVADVIETALRKGGDEGDDPVALRQGNRLVRPRTEGQVRYLRALRDHELVFCVGPAGTGKTYLAVASAVAALRRGQIKKIVLVRPAVEAGEHLGFLPGDLEAKINPYLRPLLDALHDLMDYDQIRRYMGNDLIEIAPLAYMRGRTLNDAVIILDEGQNATVPQMKMFLTRMGQNARIVVTGDITQVDLPPATISGLADAAERLGGVDGVAVILLDRSDIVRHPLVQAIVNAYEGTEVAHAPDPSAVVGGNGEVRTEPSPPAVATASE